MYVEGERKRERETNRQRQRERERKDGKWEDGIAFIKASTISFEDIHKAIRPKIII